MVEGWVRLPARVIRKGRRTTMTELELLIRTLAHWLHGLTGKATPTTMADEREVMRRMLTGRGGE